MKIKIIEPAIPKKSGKDITYFVKKMYEELKENETRTKTKTKKKI